MRRHHLVTALLGFAVVLGACGSDEATEADATKDAGVSPMDVPAVVDVPPIDVPRPDLPPVDVPPLDLGPPPDPNMSEAISSAPTEWFTKRVAPTAVTHGDDAGHEG